MSGGSQLSGEEPKWVTEMDKEVYPARSRSSMIEGDHQRSRATIATILQSTKLSIIFIASTGICWIYRQLSCIIRFKLSHSHISHTRGENRLSRVYPASLKILMIYLAHSKAPSNETSSRRTQNSASSSIERTFRHSISRSNQAIFIFVGPTIFRLDNVYATHQTAHNRQSLDLQREIFGNSGISWLTDGCFCRSRRTEEQKQQNRTLSTQHLEHRQKQQIHLETSHIYYHYYYYFKKSNADVTFTLTVNTNTNDSNTIDENSLKSIEIYENITQRVHHATHFRNAQFHFRNEKKHTLITRTRT